MRILAVVTLQAKPRTCCGAFTLFQTYRRGKSRNLGVTLSLSPVGRHRPARCEHVFVGPYPPASWFSDLCSWKRCQAMLVHARGCEQTSRGFKNAPVLNYSVTSVLVDVARNHALWSVRAALGLERTRAAIAGARHIPKLVVGENPSGRLQELAH